HDLRKVSGVISGRWMPQCAGDKCHNLRRMTGSVNPRISNYRPRIADQDLGARLKSARITVVEWPKACGKTETARRAAASEVLLDVDTAAREAVSVDPGLVLSGPTPRLIDEWQVEPS